MITKGAFLFQRIVSVPSVLGGKPCIRGTRISVEFILELIASGASRDDIIRAWPNLTAEDVDGFNAQCHVMPPLRSTEDRDGLRDAVKRGVVSAICSDHQPHEADSGQRLGRTARRRWRGLRGGRPSRRLPRIA